MSDQIASKQPISLEDEIHKPVVNDDKIGGGGCRKAMEGVWFCAVCLWCINGCFLCVENCSECL